jgi:hypothetical protein
MEEAVGRYLGVFLPFIATLICAYYIVQHGRSGIVARPEIISTTMFRRAFLATAVAVPLIIGVDVVTGGDLFLHPQFPESQLLITLLLIAVVLAFTIARSLAPLARRFKLIG